MANLTFLQAESYVRAYTNELDSAKVTQDELVIFATLAQRKVQLDIEAIGLKTFTKTVVLNGAIAALPSDLRDHNDAIRSVLCGVGAFNDRAYFDSIFSITDGEMRLQAVEPGVAGNGGILTILASDDPNTPAHGTIQFEGLSPWDFDIWVDSPTTANAVIALLMANPQFREYATVELQDGNDGTGAVDNSGYSFTTAGASGTTGWTPAHEIKPDEYDRYTQSTVYYKAPSATAPAYTIKGDPNGVKAIYFIPNSPPSTAVWTSKIVYEYLISDVTSTGSLSVPQEYEELVLIEMISKMFDKLDNTEKRDKFRVEYQAKVKELTQSYQNKISSRIQDNTRIESTGTRD